MALASEGRKETTTSPERTKVWTEARGKRKVAVVYYLTRNGHLEHPHFMEVSLSSGEGLYLRDVIGRLSFLRGKAMPALYSWSSKRSYKNGYVWHDLTDDDFIYPTHGHEYVLKGSEILLQQPSTSPRSPTTTTSSSSSDPDPTPNTAYKIYKSDPTSDASTQTDTDSKTKSKPKPESVYLPSPPHSSPSPDNPTNNIPDPDPIPCGRAKASAVLINLISCGSISVKDGRGISFAPRDRPRLMGRGSDYPVRERSSDGGFPTVVLENKEYFSGTLLEIKKKASEGCGEFSYLKRSSSYNADRSSKLELAEKEIEGVRAKCIPRKPKKETSTITSRSAHGSKRITDDAPQPN